MSKENVKAIQSEVTKETLKKLRILAIKRDLTLSKLIQDILEKHVSNNKVVQEEMSKEV